MKFALLFLLIAFSATAAPIRERGLSLHMLPDRVAKLQGERGGFTARDRETGQPVRTMVDAPEVIAYLATLPSDVAKNGVWIVYSNPAAYSKDEERKLAELVVACKKKGLAVFCCQASQLPNGWKEEGFKSEEG